MHTDPILIPAFNPGPLTGQGNNTWLLDGEEPTLIDAGVGARAHLEAVAKTLGGRPLARLLVTHGHADHISGITALRRQWPRLEAWKWPADGDAGWRAFGDGQQIRAGDRLLNVVYTPGHAKDHVCFWDETSRIVFAGDLVAQGTTVLIPGNRGGGLRAYLTSLERLAALDPRWILPGHGPAIDRPIELIQQYLEHRRAREVQVLECCRDGVADVDAIVDRIYGALGEELHRAAHLTVEAHLYKLREEGRI